VKQKEIKNEWNNDRRKGRRGKDDKGDVSS
jgi:hypothetical protein